MKAMTRGTVRRLAGLAALLGAMLSPAARADQLSIEINGINRVTGALMIAVYNTAESWDASEGAVASVRESVTGATARVVFDTLEPGPHAVMLFHDENGNGELDSNMLGIPSEDYGFSNNVGRYGRPAFAEAQFIVSGSTAITINLH